MSLALEKDLFHALFCNGYFTMHLLDSNRRHFAGYAIVNDVVNGNGLFGEVYPANDALENSQTSAIQIDSFAKPMLIHIWKKEQIHHHLISPLVFDLQQHV